MVSIIVPTSRVRNRGKNLNAMTSETQPVVTPDPSWKMKCPKCWGRDYSIVKDKASMIGMNYELVFHCRCGKQIFGEANIQAESAKQWLVWVEDLKRQGTTPEKEIARLAKEQEEKSQREREISRGLAEVRARQIQNHRNALAARQAEELRDRHQWLQKVGVKPKFDVPDSGAPCTPIPHTTTDAKSTSQMDRRPSTPQMASRSEGVERSQPVRRSIFSYPKKTGAVYFEAPKQEAKPVQKSQKVSEPQLRADVRKSKKAKRPATKRPSLTVSTKAPSVEVVPIMLEITPSAEKCAWQECNNPHSESSKYCSRACVVKNAHHRAHLRAKAAKNAS